MMDLFVYSVARALIRKRTPSGYCADKDLAAQEQLDVMEYARNVISEVYSRHDMGCECFGVQTGAHSVDLFDVPAIADTCSMRIRVTISDEVCKSYVS